MVVTTVLLGAVVGVPASTATTGEPLGAYYDQQVSWAPCKPPPPPDPSELPDDGILVPLPIKWETMECATVVVPMNYRAPDEGNLSIEVSRIAASETKNRKGVLLFNPGGPGGGGLGMPYQAREYPIAKHFDLIGFNPRGVSRLSALKCERVPVSQLPPRTSRPTEQELPAFAAYARAVEDGCRRAGGGMRPYVNTANTARDMDVIRSVLHENKINYLGYSYGTYLGAVYGSLFPHRLNRSVLDSAVHPEWLWYEQVKQQAVAQRFNVEQWADWAGERDNTYHLGTTRGEVLATTEALAARLAIKPVTLPKPRPPWPFDRTALDHLMGTGAADRSTWDVLTEIIGELRAAAAGHTDVSSDTAIAVGLLQQQGIAKTDAGVFNTVTCEADWPTDLNAYYETMRRFRDEGFHYYDGNGGGVRSAAPGPCAFRSFTPPEKLIALQRKGYPTGIVIQADGDPATGYAGGPAMAAALNNHLISIRDDGNHGHYGNNECVTERIDNYLINGVLPPSRSECTGPPRPTVPADNAGHRTQPASKESRVRAAVENRQSLWR
jgi:pimeloyl-ACP methyl ester carboxylesterase